MYRRITQFLHGKGLGWGEVFAGAGSAWAGHSAYTTAKKEGAGTTSAIARGVGEGIMVDIMGLPLYAAFHGLRWAPGAATSAAEGLGTYARGMQDTRPNMPFRNNTFVDTQTTYTMRQAGMQMAQRSRHNLQHAMLGEEARFLHR